MLSADCTFVRGKKEKRAIGDRPPASRGLNGAKRPFEPAELNRRPKAVRI